MKVKCRRVGAIGIFYWVDFPDVDTKDKWFAQYSDKWELFCFEGYEIKSSGIVSL